MKYSLQAEDSYCFTKLKDETNTYHKDRPK